MERPRTGHRHDQEGSIAVVDLIRRQHVGPVRIPSIDEVDTDALLTELLGAEQVEPARHRGKIAKAAKLIGLTVGSIVLCGSVAAAATLARSRPPASAPAVAAPTPITGIGALRPDTLEAQLSGHSSGASAPPATSARSHPPATPHQAASDVPAPASTPADDAPAAPAPNNPAQLVREFYQLVESQPSAAAQLLSPSLLSDPTGFINAWQSAAKVEVESVQANPDGTVQAVLRLLQPDGSWLRVVELLHVTQGSQPLISGAQLLSAQNG